MTAILKSSPGTLVVVRSSGEEAPSPGLLSVAGLRGSGQDVIIASFSANAQTATQIRPSIGGPHYLYSMGQQLTQMTVGLISYPDSCEEGGSEGGVRGAWAFYEREKVSPTKTRPIKLTFAGMTLHAFVLGLRTSVDASAGFPVVQMELSLAGWLDSATLGADAHGGGGFTPEGASLSGGAPAPGSQAALAAYWFAAAAGNRRPGQIQALQRQAFLGDNQ